MNLKLTEMGKSHSQSETDSGLDSVIYMSPVGCAEADKTSAGSGSGGCGASSGRAVVSVAVKRPLPNGTHENYLALKEELTLMFKVGQHVNIVNLIGK